MKNIVQFIIWATLFWVGLYMFLQFDGTINFRYWVGLVSLGSWLGWTGGLLNK